MARHPVHWLRRRQEDRSGMGARRAVARNSGDPAHRGTRSRNVGEGPRFRLYARRTDSVLPAIVSCNRRLGGFGRPGLIFGARVRALNLRASMLNSGTKPAFFPLSPPKVSDDREVTP